MEIFNLAVPDLALDQQIAAFLASGRTASLATVDVAGHPHAANVQYVSDSAWRLYWVSSQASAHSENLGAKPQAAITIYAHIDLPENIHGVQMRGTVTEVNESVVADVLQRYETKYPFVAEEPFRDAIAAQQFYCFSPNWLRWIDNRQHFGFKVEKTLGNA